MNEFPSAKIRVCDISLVVLYQAFIALIVFGWQAPALASDTCRSVQKSESALSEAQSRKLHVQWKRAVDQDKVSDLWDLMARVDVQTTNDKGKTALMAAVKVGDHCLLQELLQRGLSISDRGNTGGTTLMYAVLGNQQQMIDLVLSHNPDLNAQSTNGWTAAMIAAAKGFSEAMEQLFTAGADVNLADVYQWTPLMRAIDNQHSGVVSYLLSLPDIDVQHANENGSTALHLAAQAGNKTLVVQLLKSGSVVPAKDKTGFSAADVALQNGYTEVGDFIRHYR